MVPPACLALEAIHAGNVQKLLQPQGDLVHQCSRLETAPSDRTLTLLVPLDSW